MLATLPAPPNRAHQTHRRNARLALRSSQRIEEVYGHTLLLPGLAHCSSCGGAMLPWPWLNEGMVYRCASRDCHGGQISAKVADHCAWQLFRTASRPWRAPSPRLAAVDMRHELRRFTSRILLDTATGALAVVAAIAWRPVIPTVGQVVWRSGN